MSISQGALNFLAGASIMGLVLTGIAAFIIAGVASRWAKNENNPESRRSWDVWSAQAVGAGVLLFILAMVGSVIHHHQVDAQPERTHEQTSSR